MCFPWKQRLPEPSLHSTPDPEIETDSMIAHTSSTSQSSTSSEDFAQVPGDFDPGSISGGLEEQRKQGPSSPLPEDSTHQGVEGNLCVPQEDMASSSSNVVGVHYRVGKKIGEGSFGVIFEGTNLLNNQQVAIKFVRYDLLSL